MAKRVGIISSSSHMITFGGAAQFIRGVYQQIFEPEGIIVDIIMDKAPADPGFIESLNLSGSVYYPEDPLPYKKHTDMFSFADSANLEKEINLRDALFLACTHNIYDMLIINSIDAVSPVQATGLQRFIPVICYTHVEFSIGLLDKSQTPFSTEFIDRYSKIMCCDNIIIGTQTEHNLEHIHKVFGQHLNVVALPMCVPERGLLDTPHNIEKEGILFSGRWEPRKRPQEFVDMIAETGLPARVMTGARGVPKFEDAFKRKGITDYIIKSGIIGQDKVDFVQSCRMVYHPSKHETLSFAVVEAIISMPAVVDSDAYWHYNLESLGLNLIKTTKHNRADIIKQEYAKVPVGQRDAVLSWVESAKEKWLAAFEDGPKPSKCNFTSVDNIFYSDFLSKLGRRPSIEDVQNAFRNRGHFKITQCKDGSYLSTTGNEPPKEEDYNLESIFD